MKSLTDPAFPLVCKTCRHAFHIKCAPETHSTLAKLRQSREWRCTMCQTTSIQLPSTNDQPHITRSSNLANTIRQPRILQWATDFLQWATDFLPTNVTALRDFLGKNMIDVALIQEIKLGHEDLTLLREGCDHIHKDRQCGGIIHHISGGLMRYIQQGIQYAAQIMSIPAR